MYRPIDFASKARDITARQQLEAYNNRLTEEARERLGEFGVPALPGMDPIQAVRAYVESRGDLQGFQTMHNGQVTLVQVLARRKGEPRIHIIDYTIERRGIEYYGTRIVVAHPDAKEALILSSAHTDNPVIPTQGRWRSVRQIMIQGLRESLRPTRMTVTAFEGEAPEPQSPPVRRGNLRLV